MAFLLSTLTHGTLARSTASAAVLLVRLATLWWAVALGALALLVFRRFYDRPAPAATEPG